VKASVKSALIVGVLVPAFIAFFSAQDLIETFFPNLTLIDLGVFYVLGLISGLFAGLLLAASGRGLLGPQ
jgi:hypothetical protein